MSHTIIGTYIILNKSKMKNGFAPNGNKNNLVQCKNHWSKVRFMTHDYKQYDQSR